MLGREIGNLNDCEWDLERLWTGAAAEGINCDFCHKIVDVDLDPAVVEQLEPMWDALDEGDFGAALPKACLTEAVGRHFDGLVDRDRALQRDLDFGPDVFSEQAGRPACGHGSARCAS